MRQNIHFKNTKLIYIYIALMYLVYIAYVFLANYQLKKADHFISKNNLSQIDIQGIKQLGSWIAITDMLLPALFIISGLIVIFNYRKNLQVLLRFLLINTGLFTTILMVSCVLMFVTTLPIGNLTQPLIIPAYLLMIFLIYFVFLLIKDKLEG